MSASPRINFVNNPVPGVDQIPIIEVNPFLEAFDRFKGSAYKVYEQVYGSPVRADGLCDREYVLQETTHDQKIILEGYETRDQVLDVLKARRGKHVTLVIFGESHIRLGRGLHESEIDRA
jgi:hypothetical protein